MGVVGWLAFTLNSHKYLECIMSVYHFCAACMHTYVCAYSYSTDYRLHIYGTMVQTAGWMHTSLQITHFQDFGTEGGGGGGGGEEEALTPGWTYTPNFTVLVL